MKVMWYLHYHDTTFNFTILLQCCSPTFIFYSIVLNRFTFALLLSLLLRHRLPRLPRCPVLWTLLHHGCAHYSQWQRLPPCAGRNLLLLALLCSLDGASPGRLEQLWARGSRHHLLSGLEDPVHKQRLLHRLPFHLLPVPAILHYSLLLWQVAVRHQTGEMLLMPLHRTTYAYVRD